MFKKKLYDVTQGMLKLENKIKSYS